MTRPQAPRLSEAGYQLEAIEASRVLSNFGPVSRRFEQTATDMLFGGRGHCLAVSSATIGLMLALKEAAWRRGDRARYVVMPAFTFAAAAHAALWAGLTPVLVDVDPFDWTALADAEEDALARLGDEVAAVMPYAVFGRTIDLGRYDDMAERRSVPIVVDAASSIGTTDIGGQNFGAGFRHPVVFSLHATKLFGVGEGGLIHGADPELIGRLRRMSNFGFDGDRSAAMPGLNAKLCEIVALAACLKFEGHEGRADHRAALARVYEDELQDWSVQAGVEPRRAYQFMPMLLPRGLSAHRAALQARALDLGVGTGRYFSPHLAQQPYIRERCIVGGLSRTDELAARVMSLPMHDDLSADDVRVICAVLRRASREVTAHAEA